MSVTWDAGRVVLAGDCHVEDAEVLLQLIAAHPGCAIDLSTCRRLHGAVLQVLLSFEIPLDGAPEDAFLRDHVAPHLHRATAAGNSV